MKHKLNLQLLLLGLLSISLAHCQNNLKPGKFRWDIKSSAVNFTNNSTSKAVNLKQLLSLPLLDQKYDSPSNTMSLIPDKVGNLEEGDIITTQGYIHLVALEDADMDKGDGDYHIQLTLNRSWSDSCFIVEIPFEEFVSNPQLKALCVSNRSLLRAKFLSAGNTEFSAKGNVIEGAVMVKVTGQLFYDAVHASQMRNPDPARRRYRGKKGSSLTPMHSYTAWEIHPVTNIEILQQAGK